MGWDQPMMDSHIQGCSWDHPSPSGFDQLEPWVLVLGPGMDAFNIFAEFELSDRKSLALPGPDKQQLSLVIDMPKQAMKSPAQPDWLNEKLQKRYGQSRVSKVGSTLNQLHPFPSGPDPFINWILNVQGSTSGFEMMESDPDSNCAESSPLGQISFAAVFPPFFLDFFYYKFFGTIKLMKNLDLDLGFWDEDLR